MANKSSEVFQPLALALSSEAPRMNPAELHGMICGLIAGGLEAPGPEMLGVLASHASIRDGWGKGVSAMLVSLRDEAWQAFHGDSLELDILLPDDAQSLTERLMALAVWCDGFMAGFGTGTSGMKDSDLPPSLQEAIADLVAISQVEAPEQEDDESESLFEQVLEHCRVSALLIFTELALIRRRQKSNNTAEPTRH